MIIAVIDRPNNKIIRIDDHRGEKTSLEYNYEGIEWRFEGVHNYVHSIKANYVIIEEPKISDFSLMGDILHLDCVLASKTGGKLENYDPSYLLEIANLEPSWNSYQLELMDKQLVAYLNASYCLLDKQYLSSLFPSLKTDRVRGSHSVDKKTGRIYCRKTSVFNPMQLNNTSIERAVVASDGKILSVFDYSNFDISTILYCFGLPVKDYYGLAMSSLQIERNEAKREVFKILYSRNLKLTIRDGIEKFGSAYDGFLAKLNELITKVEEKKQQLGSELDTFGYMTTPFGRKISKTILSENVEDESDFQRLAFIYYIMNTSSDVFKHALLKIFAIRDVRVMMQRFDSVFVEVENGEQVELVRSIMENPAFCGEKFPKYSVKHKTARNLYELTRT